MRTIDAELEAGDPAWDGLFGLLQAGVSLDSPVGLSLREFMRETLRFSDEYIETAVSTVFLDGKPVDDIDAARVAEGSLVALSAAMPGLVGAVMRRNSPYASFRESISWDSSGKVAATGTGSCAVKVKFFNSVMRDRGPELLARGAVVDASDAARALGAANCATGETGNDAASANNAAKGEAPEGEGLVLLRVSARACNEEHR